jgi:CPA1 family monovalent cation:H+ antiporter
MDILTVISVLAALLAVIALAEPAAARLRLPVSVMHALFGIGIGAGANWLFFTPLTNALNEPALAIITLPLSSEVFLYVFLPVLVFEVALALNLRRMLDDWVPILALAVIAVLAATVAVAVALAPISGLPLVACFLIGAIVSTTDPSAVVSIFRATPAPQRLARIVEGESLLNDAAAIALVGVFLADLLARETAPDLGAALLRLPFTILGGAVLGWSLGRVGIWLMAHLNTWPAAQVTLSLAVPIATFLLADRVAGVSGVVAVVAAGMTINFAAPGRIAPQGWQGLRDAWALIAYVAGALIFVLAALLVPRLLPDPGLRDLVLVLVTAAAAFVARALILYGLLPLLTLARLSPRVEPPYRLAILWGGLRGAVTLALALAVTENPGVAPEVKRAVGTVAVGFTLFTLLVQGTTLRLVIGWLGLDRLTALDRALQGQVVAVALQSVRETVAETTRAMALAPAVVRDEAVRFGDRLEAAVQEAETAGDLLDKDRVTLGMLALAGHERDLVLDAFRDGLVPARLAERLVAGAERLIERTRAEGRAGYRAEARRALRPGRAERLAVRLHNRIGLSRPLERLTADRFETLLAEGQVLRALHRFVDGRILRIHGRRVADLLHDLLQRRSDDLEKEIAGLRLQFPGYAERLERGVIRRIGLMQELREYDQLTQDGLIGPELHATLRRAAEARRAAIEDRPRLDLVLQKSDLVARFPLFADMPAADRARLAGELRTIYAEPGEVLMRQDETPRGVWFIASGAVEMVQADRTVRLGRGEIFGELALLLRRPRRARVVAITHCTLLALEEARFLDLIRGNDALCALVRERAAKRGVEIDPRLLAVQPAPRRPRPLRWLDRALRPVR